MPEFTHMRGDRVHMIDITEKGEVHRVAIASGRIYLREETLTAIRTGSVVKGNVLVTAEVAGIMAVKGTSSLIPMCHQIPITGVDVDFSFGEGYLEVQVRVTSLGKTGVEMEALTGVSVALLTVWDMVKSAEKDTAGQYPSTEIGEIRVLEKRKVG
ncbi:MAG: cyclic pyranopterin monophosphate synthase MoaC [Methanomicrobiales archaeon]|nr:cyclic pyranopterin monophosphate synthase MoaC [Methanomicrobiales archaeon]